MAMPCHRQGEQYLKIGSNKEDKGQKFKKIIKKS
jgi:hypothetical protein